MHMLISTLRNTPARFGQDHMVPLFNATRGMLVKATLADVETEVARLRTLGVHDDDQGAWPAPAGGTTGRRAAEPSAAFAPPSAPSDSTSTASGCTTITYASRADLIRHLAAATRAADTTPGAVAIETEEDAMQVAFLQGHRKRRREGNLIDERIAVARSTITSAAGTREGPGGPVREAGAAAAVALRLGAGATAAVTAKREAVQLPFDHSTAAGPPNGRAAPLDGYESVRGTRPVSTTSQARPTSPERGRAPLSGDDSLTNTVGGPPRESARRREGAGEPPACASVARCGVDATGPGVGKRMPLKGIARDALDARNECIDQAMPAREPAEAGHGQDGDRDADADREAGGRAARRDHLRHPLELPLEHRGLHRLQGPPVPGGPHRHRPPRAQEPPPAGRLQQRAPPRGGDLQGHRLRALLPCSRSTSSAAAEDDGTDAAAPRPSCAAAASAADTRLLGDSHRGEPIMHLEQAVDTRCCANPAMPRPPARRGHPADQASGCQPAGSCTLPTPIVDRIVSGAPRRRITGKSKPMDTPTAPRSEPHLPPADRHVVGWNKGSVNSPLGGDGMSTADAEVDGGTLSGPNAARLHADIGFKLTRHVDECMGIPTIGNEALPPALACGEKNTLKSTWNSCTGLGAAGQAADGASSAAAACPSPFSTRPDA